MIFRSLFAIISVVTFILYVWNCCKFNFKDLSFETRHVWLLSVSLIIFNNPFYSLSIYFPNYGWTIYNSITCAQFVAFCLYFWLAVFEKYKEYDRCTFLRWIKFAFAWILFVSLTVFYAYVTEELRHNPNYSLEEDLKQDYYSLFIAVIILILIYLLWSTVLVVRACNALKEQMESSRINIRF